MPELGPKDEWWARHRDGEDPWGRRTSAGKRSRSEETTPQAPLPFKGRGQCRELAEKKAGDGAGTNHRGVSSPRWLLSVHALLALTCGGRGMAHTAHSAPSPHLQHLSGDPGVPFTQEESLSPPLEPRLAMGLALSGGLSAGLVLACPWTHTGRWKTHGTDGAAPAEATVDRSVARWPQYVSKHSQE